MSLKSKVKDETESGITVPNNVINGYVFFLFIIIIIALINHQADNNIQSSNTRPLGRNYRHSIWREREREKETMIRQIYSPGKSHISLCPTWVISWWSSSPSTGRQQSPSKVVTTIHAAHSFHSWSCPGTDNNNVHSHFIEARKLSKKEL